MNGFSAMRACSIRTREDAWWWALREHPFLVPAPRRTLAMRSSTADVPVSNHISRVVSVPYRFYHYQHSFIVSNTSVDHDYDPFHGSRVSGSRGIYKTVTSVLAAPSSIDNGYTPGACSGPSDVTGPPLLGRPAPCGTNDTSSPGRRVILEWGKLREIKSKLCFIFSTIAHDGTHQIRENYQDINSVNWDPYLGLWSL